MRGRIGRRDPEGYFVVVAMRGIEEFFRDFGDIKVEVSGDKVIIKTKSRHIALKILELAEKKKLALR